MHSKHFHEKRSIFFKNITYAFLVRHADKKCDSINLLSNIFCHTLKKIRFRKIFCTIQREFHLFMRGYYVLLFYFVEIFATGKHNQFFLLVLKFRLFSLSRSILVLLARFLDVLDFFILMNIWIFHAFIIIRLFVRIFFHLMFNDKHFAYIFIFHLLYLIYPFIENWTFWAFLSTVYE